mgnify:FL=1
MKQAVAQPELESTLYAPVKAMLEGRGFDVKAEIGGADVLAINDGAMLIVELKTKFSLTLLQQAVERQRVTELVYVAVPAPKGRTGSKAFKANVNLCRRLGIGVLSVTPRGQVVVEADPGPYTPRPTPKKRALLLREFSRRRGDPNLGGTRGSIETAYRQDARDCARYLHEQGAARGRDVAKATGVVNATRIMADNYFGWFQRVSTGIYDLSDVGRTALVGL